ncbi:MAG: alpha-amylase [Methylococcaceae bacterium]|nr:alpha-amylase [Methylococcaceae bacterium]
MPNTTNTSQEKIERSLSDIDWAAFRARKFTPSPAAWEDQVLYFLMLDRFSDGKETSYRGNDGANVTTAGTPLFKPNDIGNAIGSSNDAQLWQDAGGKWVGGTLQGLTSKIGYLSRLGVTAIWVSPIFKQIAFQETYHGYGIQNFLDVDPHFGSRADLKTLVDTAHQLGIYVVLDIILNHSGNVFGYDPDRYPFGEGTKDARWDGRPYAVKGFRDKTGKPSIPFASSPTGLNADDAVWPVEFQEPHFYTQKGRIDNWDYDPEFREGDFSDLKDIHLGDGDANDYQPSPALKALCQVYKFWIAYADFDGFRVDTVKHMDLGATRYFSSVIHEFSQSIGKENFYLIGEITGGRERAFDTLDTTGLDAALGIDDIPDKLEFLVKGYRNPQDYFSLFRNSLLVQKDSHVWFKNKVVTVYDDHDQVRKGGNKARYCAGNPAWRKLALNVLALNAMTLGIPCIYYGSEQGFDGEGGNDRYIREAMFGGEFGPFRSKDRHCFDEDNSLYQALAKILEIRKSKTVLRRGRQYLRQISASGNEGTFGYPVFIGERMLSIVPWSRIFNDEEMVLAINTDIDNARTAWITIDNQLHDGKLPFLQCLYSTDAAQIGNQTPIEARNGKAVQITVPAGGFVIFE